MNSLPRFGLLSSSFVFFLAALFALSSSASAQNEAPGVPTGVEAHPASDSGTPPINLTWDPTPGATSYIIWVRLL